jgi:hypothetical protein
MNLTTANLHVVNKLFSTWQPVLNAKTEQCVAWSYK